MKFDTTKEGLYTLFKPYQVMLLEHIWDLNENERVGVNSSRAHEYLLTTSEKKSRASVIFFLNDLVDEGILDYEERTGKGGHHRVYYPKMNRDEYAAYVTECITKKLGTVFPAAQKLKA
jgi:hypothetical protein